VGLDEKTAQEQGLKFTTKKEDTSGWYSARRVGVSHSGFKVLIENDTQRILGAHLFGWHADETINIIALAIRNHLPASTLKDMVYAFPTSASDLNSMF
jgi:glutathione reductase (NADPH)